MASVSMSSSAAHGSSSGSTDRAWPIHERSLGPKGRSASGARTRMAALTERDDACLRIYPLWDATNGHRSPPHAEQRADNQPGRTIRFKNKMASSTRFLIAASCERVNRPADP